MYETGKTRENHFSQICRLSGGFTGFSGFCVCVGCNDRILIWWFSMHSMFIQRFTRWRLAFMALTVALCVAAHGQSDKEKDTSAKPKYGVSKPLGDTYVATKSVEDEQTRLVLYRVPHNSDKPADKLGVVSVYLNEHYHASLQKDAFSVICLGGKKTEVRTRYLPDVTADIHPEHDSRHTLASKGGQSIFLRIADTVDQKTRIEVVSHQTAGKDLADAKQQMHRRCDSGGPTHFGNCADRRRNDG